MFRKSFKLKIILPPVIVLVVLIVVLSIFCLHSLTTLSDLLIEEKFTANVNSLERYLEDSKANSRAAVISLASNPDVIKAVRERDRDEILHIFTPLFDLYRINFYTILDSDGIVLVRVHEPDNYGDSLAYQQNIQDAINGNVSTYFEEGTVVKVSVRTGAPVYDTDGTLIGILSSGVRFDSEEAIADLKTHLNTDVAIFLGDTIIPTETNKKDGKIITDQTLGPEIARIVIDNKLEYWGASEIFGEKYSSFYKPLLDAQNEVFATIFLGMPLSVQTGELNRLIRNGLIIGLIALIVSIVLLSLIISSISKPISILADNMNDFANGDIHIDILTRRKDEIGRLNMSLNKSAGITQQLLGEIRTLITEQEKGNIEYHFNAECFPGIYRQLADDISELANFSVKDHLTGIPNRRSFDNRLKLTWNWATREKLPISLMIMDIDKFKLYNDEFGHLQGDVALQCVANTLKHSIRRSSDFYARWGGEEFIILLSDTDAAGAVKVAENIRSEVEKTNIPCSDARAMRVTVSIGICTQIPLSHTDVDKFIFQTDSALYQAKENGRNCCVGK